VLDKSVTVL